MNNEEKIAESDRLCRMAGCTKERAAKHLALYLKRWDVHPPPDFLNWLSKFDPDVNKVSAWNADSARQEYYKWIGQGKPEPPPLKGINHAEELQKLRETIGRIGKP